MPVPSEREGVVAVERLHAWFEERPRGLVAHRERHVDHEPVDVVDHRLEAREPGHRPVVHREPREFLDRLHDQIGAPEEQRRVDLVLPVAGDVHESVARDPDDRRLVLGGVDGHDVDRVRPLALDRLIGTRIRADHQHEDGLAAVQDRDVLGVGRLELEQRRGGRSSRRLGRPQGRPGHPGHHEGDQERDPAAEGHDAHPEGDVDADGDGGWVSWSSRFTSKAVIVHSFLGRRSGGGRTLPRSRSRGRCRPCVRPWPGRLP